MEVGGGGGDGAGHLFKEVGVRRRAVHAVPAVKHVVGYLRGKKNATRRGIYCSNFVKRKKVTLLQVEPEEKSITQKINLATATTRTTDSPSLPACLPPPDRLALRYLAVVVGVLLYEADGRLLRPVRVAAVVVRPAGLPGEDLLQPRGGPRQAGAPALAAGGRPVVAGAARLAEAPDRELRGLAEEGGVGGEGALEPEEVVLKENITIYSLWKKCDKSIFSPCSS